MATGGIGGVHRGFPNPPDVSADLGELARTPALVVSAGVKSLLDVPATAELLETLGVPVLGFRVDTLPLFYGAAGGPPVSARVESAEEAARVATAHWELGGAGVLVGRPPDDRSRTSSRSSKRRSPPRRRRESPARRSHHSSSRISTAKAAAGRRRRTEPSSRRTRASPARSPSQHCPDKTRPVAATGRVSERRVPEDVPTRESRSTARGHVSVGHVR